MEEVISAFLHLLHDTESFVRRSGDQFEGDQLATFLHDFRCKRVNPLYRRVKRMEDFPYVLSMVGLTNVGKSTLFHALLGHPVAPRRNGPATAIPVEYEYSESWSIKTLSRGEQRIFSRSFESPSLVSKDLEKLVLEQVGPAGLGDKKPEKIVVQGPMDLLREGFVLADTPGFGAVKPNAPEESPDKERIVDYLKSRVHEVMFCVSGANSMVSPSEVQCFREIQESCSTIIVTKWDCDADERDKEIERYRAKFTDLFPYCGFVFVEAKWAIEGKERQSIEELASMIRDRATLENRLNALRAQLVNAWEDFHALVREPLNRAKAPRMPWHRAALPKFLGCAEKESLNLTTTL